MKSMTGYGRCQMAEDGREMAVEVKSVNHRFLDISYRLSRTLSFLDDAVRKGVSARLARGHVDVFVSYANHRQDAKEVRVDTALAMAYRQALIELAAAVGKEPEAMKKTDRMRIIRMLYKRRAFTYQKSVAIVAERLNVSRYTVYKYMHELEEAEQKGEHLAD